MIGSQSKYKNVLAEERKQSFTGAEISNPATTNSLIKTNGKFTVVNSISLFCCIEIVFVVSLESFKCRTA